LSKNYKNSSVSRKPEKGSLDKNERVGGLNPKGRSRHKLETLNRKSLSW